MPICLVSIVSYSKLPKLFMVSQITEFAVLDFAMLYFVFLFEGIEVYM